VAVNMHCHTFAMSIWRSFFVRFEHVEACAAVVVQTVFSG
jgi:hypothetical protein